MKHNPSIFMLYDIVAKYYFQTEHLTLDSARGEKSEWMLCGGYGSAIQIHKFVKGLDSHIVYE